MEIKLNKTTQKLFKNYRLVIDWIFIISGLVFLFLSERYIGGDSVVRFNAVKSLMENGEILIIKYSLIMPLFATPVYFIGSLFGEPDLFLTYFNYIILLITLLLSYIQLKEFYKKERLRLFIIITINASMFTCHVNYFNGELLSACLMFLGIILVIKDKSIFGPVLLALSAANQPGLLPGMAAFCLYMSVSKKNIKFLFIPVLTLLIIFSENYLKYGNFFITGYENDYGYKTIMPYSSLPGFSYPVFFGLLSIIFSFGKGLLWFTPGIFLPYSWYDKNINTRSQLLIKSTLITLAATVLFYSKWWSWYGGFFWGPRFFLLASFPASLILASSVSENKTSIPKSFMLLSVLLLSFWVGFNGANFDPQRPNISIQLEFMVWYVPEFSVLWKPFIGGLTLELHQKVQLAFSAAAFFWCAKYHFVHLIKILRQSK